MSSSSSTITMQGYMMKKKGSHHPSQSHNHSPNRHSFLNLRLKLIADEYVTRYFVLHTDGRLIYHKDGPPTVTQKVLERGGPGGTILCKNVNECEIDRIFHPSDLASLKASGDKTAHKMEVANSFYITVPHHGKILLVTHGPEEYKRWMLAFRNRMRSDEKNTHGMSVPNNHQLGLQQEEDNSSSKKEKGQSSEMKKVQAQLVEEQLSSTPDRADDIDDKIEDARRRLTSATLLASKSDAKLERACTELSSARKEIQDATKILQRLEERKRADDNKATTTKQPGVVTEKIAASSPPASPSQRQAAKKFMQSQSDSTWENLVESFRGQHHSSKQSTGMVPAVSDSVEASDKKSHASMNRATSLSGESQNTAETEPLTPGDSILEISNTQSKKLVTTTNTDSGDQNHLLEDVTNETKNNSTEIDKTGQHQSDEDIVERKITGMSDISEQTNLGVEGDNDAGPKSRLTIKKDEDESYAEFLSIISDSPGQETYSLGDDVLDDLLKKCDSIMECSEIEVTGCGIPEVNGQYHKFGTCDGVPSYSKIASYEGKDVMFNINRWQSNNGTRKWYITGIIPGGSSKAKRLVFYVAYTPNFHGRPPRRSWMAVMEGNELFLSPAYEGRGISPVPVIVLESDDATITRKNFGKKISSALSTGCANRSSDRSRRSTVRSVPSIGSLSTTKSMKHENIPASVYLPPSLFD